MPRVTSLLKSMASPAVTVLPVSPLSLLAVTYRAAVASWETLLRMTSLSVRPLALTLSAFSPWGATFTALLKKEELRRLVAEV